MNVVTIQDRFSIPTVDKLFDELRGSTFFIKLDLHSSFHKIRLHTDSIPKSAFRTHNGHFEFLVMHFGLFNAPSTFQATMNSNFKPFLYKFVLVFYNDILIYKSYWLAHLNHIRQIFHQLCSKSLKVKFSKCTFVTTRIHYIGHIITSKDVEVDLDKISAITS